MKKSISFLLVMIVMMTIAIPSYSQVYIGNGTSHERYPFGILWGYERSAAIYKSSEIQMFGTITHLGWNVEASYTSVCPAKIYLLTVADSTLVADTWANITNTASLVFDGDLVFNASGWHMIDIADFNYSSGNLLVLVETNYTGTGTMSYPRFYYSENNSLYQSWWADNSPPLGLGSINNKRPNIKIDFQSFPVPNCAVDYSPYDGETNVVTNKVLSWQQNGGFPVSYDVYFGLSNPPPFVQNTTNLTYSSFSNLVADTTYYYKIVPKNSVGDALGCPVIEFTTSPNYTFCDSYALYSDDEEIFRVVLGSMSQYSDCMSTGGPGSILNKYSDFTDLAASPNLQQGNYITFSVNVGTCGMSYQNAVKIFIDFNKDGYFDNNSATEMVYVSPNSSNGPHFESGLIYIPVNAVSGKTRMRVICVETNNPSSIYPCGAYDYGETEDYFVNIVENTSQCYVPTGLSYSNNTMFWNAVTGAAQYYEWRVVNLGAGVNSPAVDSGLVFFPNHTAVPTNLQSLTEYDFYVRTNCGLGIYSDWSLNKTFLSACNQIFEVPYFEDFETNTRLCWGQISDYNPPSWIIDSNLTHLWGGSFSLQNDWAVSPNIVMPLCGNVLVKFRSLNDYPGFYGKNSLLISNDNGLNYTEIWSPLSVVDQWVYDSIDISAYLGDTIKIAFRYEGTNAHVWYVDDVEIFVASLIEHDLAVFQSDLSFCNNQPQFLPEITVKNVGSGSYIAGTDLYVSYKMNEEIWHTATLTLLQSLYPGDEIIYEFQTGVSVPGDSINYFKYVVKNILDTNILNDTAVFSCIRYLYPEFYLGNDTTLCSGTSLLLNADNPGANYLWWNNSTSQVLNADVSMFDGVPGTYPIWVEVTNNSCTTLDTILITWDVCSGFQSLVNTKFKMYPNPTTDIVFIELFEYQGDLKLEVYDICSRQVFSEQIRVDKTGTIVLDLKDMISGIYFIRLLSDELNEINRLIKK